MPNTVLESIAGLDFRVDEKALERAKANPETQFIPEFAKCSDGQEYMRGIGSSIIYRAVRGEKGEINYECNRCKIPILSTRVAHTTWFEDVPYCPRCEERPSSIGKQINREYEF